MIPRGARDYCTQKKNKPFEFDVDENREGQRHDDQCQPHLGHEHDDEAEDDTERGERPVVEAKSRPPAGRADDRLESAGKVDETVAHEEEHGDDRCHLIDVTNQNTDFGDDERAQLAVDRFGAAYHLSQWIDDRYDVVLSDSL